ncbi:MAG: gfo/Idh/MocA family oxidoreductase [Acidobacteria bacterium]|nr:MAG: gfo/Idh/MocA family oxidoreductase [Acidobacteriota bacterium]
MSDLSRRQFVSTAAKGTAVAWTALSRSRVLGANDRIAIGQIGCGDRGIDTHMKTIHKYDAAENVQFTAVCDPWRPRREEAAGLIKAWYGIEAKTFVSYEDLLALKDVDAVMIASCDHQHARHLEAVAKAGKDAYCEKPLAKNMDELITAFDAVKKAGIVVQVGTQLRSFPSIVGSREVYKTGILGKVSRIEQVRNDTQPFWYRYVKDVKADDVDWKQFLMGLQMRPFNAVQYSGWYGFRDYCDGLVPQWGSHYIDTVHYITGAQFPSSCVCQGDIYTWKDEYGFTVDDQVQAVWTYPEGFLVTYTTNFGNSFGNLTRVYGDQGLLKMDNLMAPVLTAEGGSKNKGVIRGVNPVKAVEHPDHFLNWLQCLRCRKAPNAPIEAGYQHAVACLMAVESQNKGARMVYDHANRKIHQG